MKVIENERMKGMLAEERYSEILRVVNEEHAVTVQELTELLDTSESTIRRDLTTLHKRRAGESTWWRNRSRIWIYNKGCGVVCTKRPEP